MSTGQRIKRSRDGHGWTQEDLARRAGLSAMTISHYETSRRIPSVNNLIKVADALRVTTDHLLRFGALPTHAVTPEDET